MTNTELKSCPFCGKQLVKSKAHTFSSWGTLIFMFLISLMLVALDILPDSNNDRLIWNFDWSLWAIIGMWIFYTSVQLLRFNVDYGWVLIPFGGILFSFFFFYLDRASGLNSGYLGLDWAWWLIIPWITFIVILPLIARIARSQPKHIDLLRDLVNILEDEENATT